MEDTRFEHDAREIYLAVYPERADKYPRWIASFIQRHSLQRHTDFITERLTPRAATGRPPVRHMLNERNFLLLLSTISSPKAVEVLENYINRVRAAA